jgi:hypothetical protein
MLDMIEQTAKKVREQIAEIEKVMNKMGPEIQKKLPKVYCWRFCFADLKNS